MRIDSIDIRSSFTKYNDNQRIDFSKKNNCIFFYGSNGTGKSSLSKLFSISDMAMDGNDNYKERLSLLKTIDSSKDLDVSVCYNNESFTLFTNDIVNPIKIPVFNKDYIDSKITYQSDFKNNRFQEKTSNYGIELESKTNYNKKIAEIEENNIKGKELIEKINKQIDLGIIQTIKDTSTTRANQKYNNEYNFKSFSGLNPKDIPIDGLDQLREKHIKYITDLKDINSDDSVQLKIDELSNEQNLLDRIKNINEMISFSEDKTKLDFVKQHLDNFDLEERNWKIKGATLLKNNKCPFCEQNIDNNSIVQMYKDYVNSKLRKTEEFINEQKSYFESANSNIDFQYRINETKTKNIDKIFNSNIIIQIQQNIKIIKNFNLDIIELLNNKSKEENLYYDCSDLLEKISLSTYENIITEYHQLLLNIDEINKRILKSNAERKKVTENYLNTTGKFIVYNLVRKDLEEFKLLYKKSLELNKEAEELKKIYQEELKGKNELLKTINSILDDFTITNYRIDEKFDLYLNDCSVSQKADRLLSDGEKNIIAFALFISELKLLYSETEKSIIFIDDPITSVDYPNLYSIYNYLIDIITENNNSQIIITSHNILFLNLFKFRYNGNATYFKLKEDSNGKTNCYLDTDTSDSIYLEKLKEIYNIATTNTIDSKQKLYIHNYCRYVVETLSRFEFPNYKKESSSSDFYIRKLKEQIKENPESLNVSNNSLDILNNIINKGSHATIEIVHDNEYFDDKHYVKCCKTIIEIIKTKYSGQFELLSFDKTKEISVDKLNVEEILSEAKS